MKTLSLEVRSLGANNELLIDLLNKKPDTSGKIRWQQGDKASIEDGISITYDHQTIYEAEGIAEPIYFTITFMSGIAGNLIATYIYDKIRKYKDKIKEIKVDGKLTALSREEIEKAFLQAIDDIEKRET